MVIVKLKSKPYLVKQTVTETWHRPDGSRTKEYQDGDFLYCAKASIIGGTHGDDDESRKWVVCFDQNNVIHFEETGDTKFLTTQFEYVSTSPSGVMQWQDVVTNFNNNNIDKIKIVWK